MEPDNYKYVLTKTSATDNKFKGNILLEEHKVGSVNEIEKQMKNKEPFELFDVTLNDVFEKHKEHRIFASEIKPKSFLLRNEVIKLEETVIDSQGSKKEYVGIEPLTKLVQVTHGGKIIYKAELIDEPFSGGIQSFYVENGHWVLEFQKAQINDNKVTKYLANVVVDGVNLNEKFGAEEIFNYIFINDKPLYFYKNRSGNVKLSYDGHDLSDSYQEVKHYLCCSDGYYNPGWNKRMIAFWGVRDGFLYYCEAGFFQ